MAAAIISVNRLWKQYRLGDTNAGSLKEEVHGWWTKRRNGRPEATGDPAEGNHLADRSDKSAFWALKDIDFKVHQGDARGIIGKNGAGKSTLLKILSRITRPTRGSVHGQGRVASMLEVGTGFHNELTGRENIFLNGNILGMSNREIRQKFDSIVDFSGISKFIDTPIKRYSSGMYVRLAFSVAAHLDPDILLLDEVLAVGDTEFQEKSLRKMKEIIAQKGCTILFVSHNIPSVLQLCNRAILLKEGRMAAEGRPQRVVNDYYTLMGKEHFYQRWNSITDAPGNATLRLTSVRLSPERASEDAPIDVRTPLHIDFGFMTLVPDIRLSVGIHLFSNSGECIFDVPSSARQMKKGTYEGHCTIPGGFLNDGTYYLSIIFVRNTIEPIFYMERCLAFDVADFRGDIQWQGKWMGAVRPNFPVVIHQTNDLSSKLLP